MKTKAFFAVFTIALIAALLNVQRVLAHETITVGMYEIEVGWLNEPPVAGQQNAVVVGVSDTASGEVQPVEDISSLSVTISYGGQSKVLTLEPLGEETSGGFIATILPTLPGEYEVEFGGRLGEITVDAHTHIEEVQPADTIQFPALESAQANSGTDWLVWLSLLVGFTAVGLGVSALRNSR